ncbi:hypothetical protein D9M70_588780 [compost metagenome]
MRLLTAIHALKLTSDWLASAWRVKRRIGPVGRRMLNMTNASSAQTRDSRSQAATLARDGPNNATPIAGNRKIEHPRSILARLLDLKSS